MTRRSEAPPDPKAEALAALAFVLGSWPDVGKLNPLERSILETHLRHAHEQVLAIQPLKKPRRPKPATTA